MDVFAEYNKLKKKKSDAGGFKPLILEDPMKIYRKTYVQTKAYNEDTKKYEWFDQRTGTFFNKSETKEYLKSENDKFLKKYYLENFGTETPYKDLQYLKQATDLERYKNRKNLSIDRSSSLLHGFRHLLSRKVEGSDQKVFDAQHDKEIARRNQLLIKAKEGTSYQRQEDAQVELKINESVTNQENQPINIKDLSVVSPYVEQRREQLKIDEKFNTSPSGVVY